MTFLSTPIVASFRGSSKRDLHGPGALGICS
jgi:hypothetical protein